MSNSNCSTDRNNCPIFPCNSRIFVNLYSIYTNLFITQTNLPEATTTGGLLLLHSLRSRIATEPIDGNGRNMTFSRKCCNQGYPKQPHNTQTTIRTQRSSSSTHRSMISIKIVVRSPNGFVNICNKTPWSSLSTKMPFFSKSAKNSGEYCSPVRSKMRS